MQVRLKVFERGFQRPAFAVEVSHPFGRHLARDIGQDVEHRRPVSGRFVQLEAQATKEMLGALRIYHAHALLGHLTRWRAATRAQRASNLKTSPLMCTGDEEGAQVVDLTEKIPGTKIAVFNPQITGLYRLEERPEQRAFLSMAVFAGKDIGHQATGGLK